MTIRNDIRDMYGHAQDVLKGAIAEADFVGWIWPTTSSPNARCEMPNISIRARFFASTYPTRGYCQVNRNSLFSGSRINWVRLF